jgi:hypothetical protein
MRNAWCAMADDALVTAGVALFMGGWAVVVSAIAGAIVAAVYNSLLSSRSTLDKSEPPKTP